MITAGGLAFATCFLAAPSEFGDRYLAITQTSREPQDGLVDTTPFAGLRPSLHVRVAGAFSQEREALAECERVRAKGGECYVKFAGPRRAPIDADGARVLAQKAFPGRVYVRSVSLRGERVPVAVSASSPEDEDDVPCDGAGRPTRKLTAHLYWAERPILLGEKQLPEFCCSQPDVVPAPDGLGVVRVRCQDVPGHLTGEWVLALPEDDLTSARAIETSCNEYPHASDEGIASNTCDRVTISPKAFRVRLQRVELGECPGGASGAVAREQITTFVYSKRVIRRRQAGWRPYMTDFFRCEEDEARAAPSR